MALESDRSFHPGLSFMEISNAWRPLRTWIAVLILPAMLLVRFIPDLVPNGPSNIWMASAFGPFLIGLLVILWWLFASRARWFERVIGLLGLVAAVVIEQAVCHESMRGALLIVMTIPMTIAGFGIGCVLFGKKLTLQRTWLGVVGSWLFGVVAYRWCLGQFRIWFRLALEPDLGAKSDF